MELLLRRNDALGTLGQARYDLFAKLEPTQEEQAVLRRAQTKTTYLLEMDQTTVNKYWRISLFLGIGAAFLLGVILGIVTLRAWVFWIVLLVSFYPLRKIIFNQLRKDISVEDLLVGRTIRLNSLEAVVDAENTLKQNAMKYRQYLQSMRPTGEPERFSLDSE
jgi:hypothetical protein